MTKKTSYGRIKETTVGGFVMPRSYRKMEEYEEEILRLREEGKTKREICEKFGFTMKQMTNFITRYNTRQKQLATGIVIRRKGRPPKDYEVSEQDKIAELRYILARKESRTGSIKVEWMRSESWLTYQYVF